MRELEAIHQLSKNIHSCIGGAYSMITPYKQLEMLLEVSNLGMERASQQISSQI
jgi:hypothetical protein